LKILAAGPVREARDPVLERDMRHGGAFDESHRARAGSERLCRVVGGFEQRGVMRQRQIAVRVHPQELAVASAECAAGSPRAARRHVSRDDAFGRLGARFLLERLHVFDERSIQLVEGIAPQSTSGAALTRPQAPVPSLGGIASLRSTWKDPAEVS
jgi:hypothetical protein